MKIKIVRDSEGTRAIFTGNIDQACIDEVRELFQTLAENEADRFILDFDNVEFVDSAGLGALVAFRKSKNGKRIVLVNVNDRIKKLLAITRSDTIFEME